MPTYFIETSAKLIQSRTRRALKAQKTRCLKLTNYYQRGDCNSVNQTETNAWLVPQALPVHLDQEEEKGPGDEEARKEELETREIKELWDRQERAASKALWGLKG